MRVIEICEPLTEGVGRHVTDVALGLSRRGHDVHVIYSPFRVDPVLLARLSGAPGVSLIKIPMRREPHWSDLVALVTLRMYIGRNGPFDVIHAHSSKAGVLARLVGIISTAGVVYTPHAFVTMADNTFSPRVRFVYGLIERALAPFTSRIVCSAAVEFDHARNRLNIPEQRLVTLLNGIDTATFRFESDLRRELLLAPDTPIIGFVGRLGPQKGADIAIRALASILAVRPESVLVIIGHGKERDGLETLASSYRVSHAIRWLGDRQAREYFHNFDLLVCPSRYDAGAYTPIEGLYCGLPIICTPVGMVREIVIHGVNGFIVPPEDPDALATQTIALLNNPDLRDSVSRAARSIDDYFLLDRMLNELEEIYFGRLSGWRPLMVMTPGAGDGMANEAPI